MARINKKDVKKPVKQEKVEKNLSGIKEESEKGELFFQNCINYYGGCNGLCCAIFCN